MHLIHSAKWTGRRRGMLTIHLLSKRLGRSKWKRRFICRFNLVPLCDHLTLLRERNQLITELNLAMIEINKLENK